MRVSGIALVLALAGLPVSTLAQDAPPLQTAQQYFDAATQAASAGDNAKAYELLDTVEKRLSNPRSKAIVQLRKGMALVEMARWQEARALLDGALAVLPEDDHSLDGDRASALRSLGRMALGNIDYEAALTFYVRAFNASSTPADQISALIGQAQAGVFLDPAVALERGQQAEALLSKLPATDKKASGYVAAVQGRALLNLGRFAEAETAFARTVRAEGGLSLKVGYDDLVARSDASIAAMLAGHRDSARNYLVYTGAGRIEEQDFTAGADMTLPACGEDGVTPDDVAVIEFGIKDDGSVDYARPVYGSRPGGMALVFARAVSNWAWQAEDVSKIPALFRMVTRLELRCSTSEGGASLVGGLRAAFRQWVEQGNNDIVDDGRPTENRRVADLQSRLAALNGQSTSAISARAWILAELLASPFVAGDNRVAYVKSLTDLIATQNLPPLARLYADVLMTGGFGKAVIAEQPYIADPRAHASWRLISYDMLQPSKKRLNQALLNDIIADTALPADDPLRVAALTRRAAAKVAARDMAGAQSDFLATGLTEQQCSIVDAQPNLQGNPSSSSDYPMDMVRVGVEGWTKIQFDVNAAGQTLNRRAVITYPPMVFSNNGLKIVSRARFEQSYRPSGGLGCGGNNMKITFRVPE